MVSPAQTSLELDMQQRITLSFRSIILPLSPKCCNDRRVTMTGFYMVLKNLTQGFLLVSRALEQLRNIPANLNFLIQKMEIEESKIS